MKKKIHSKKYKKHKKQTKARNKPPWTNLVDLEDVPEAKSSLSTRPTRRPLVTASRATPHPVAPPPITRTSSGFSAVASTRDDR